MDSSVLPTTAASPSVHSPSSEGLQSYEGLQKKSKALQRRHFMKISCHRCLRLLKTELLAPLSRQGNAKEQTSTLSKL